MIPNFFPRAIQFAINQPQVQAEISERATKNYLPLGINARIVRVDKFKQNFIRVTFDYLNSNNDAAHEDLLVWVGWKGDQLIFCGVHELEEVDGRDI
ncbi:MAG: hypothetical protein RLP15_01270 [Cryomorphaceae bacterium]